MQGSQIMSKNSPWRTAMNASELKSLLQPHSEVICTSAAAAEKDQSEGGTDGLPMELYFLDHNLLPAGHTVYKEKKE